MASASLSWSGPTRLDHNGGNSLAGVACPAAGQCIAVSRSPDQQVTFDPAAPGTPSGVPIDRLSWTLDGIDCPSASQCTAIDSGGHAITFDPSSQAVASPTTVDGLQTLNGIACPSVSQCTVVDYNGGEVTFDPGSPGSPTRSSIDGGQNTSAVACPSTTQCTAVDSAGNESTFDPASPGTATPTDIDGTAKLQAITCPSTSQCTAVDGSGNEITFDPNSPGNAGSADIDAANRLLGVACPSESQCIAVDADGSEVTFDPASASGSNPQAIDSSHALAAVACTSTSQCVAVDNDGEEVAFDPGAPGSASSTSIANGNTIASIDCPSVSQCTAVDVHGQEMTFNPGAPTTPTPVTIDGANQPVAVACPSASQCILVDYEGREVTFDPNSPASSSAATIDNRPLSGIACPSVSQCTAVDATKEITFDPESPGSPSSTTIQGEAPAAVSCPSSSQCTVVDDSGGEATFDPQSPGTPTRTSIAASNDTLNAIACPSVSQCTAIDIRGNSITFDPNAPGSPTPDPIDAGNQLHAVACASTTQCVAADWIGEALEGDPSSSGAWTLERDSDWRDLTAVACPSTVLCVSVTSAGDAIIGSSNDTDVPPPVATGPPTITGIPNPGQTLNEAAGSWTNNPTSYAYAWEDCDGSGGNCLAIPGATGQNYTLTSADAGHEIRVVETAANAGGPGAPATSSATAVVVIPPPPSSSSAPSILGIVNPGQTLTDMGGSWTNNPTSIGYQWEDCDGSGNGCEAIADATNQSYRLGASDVDHTIRVVETAANAGGSGGSATSAATPVVVVPPPPTNSAPPTISGIENPGQTLTVSDGSWTNNPLAYSYQWEVCDGSGAGCVAIPGATNQSYTLSVADVGHTLRAQEAATNAGGSGDEVTSAATAVVVTPAAPSTTSSPTISGMAIVGQALTESHAAWTNNPLSYAYVWEACDGSGNNCAPIPGATGQTYQIAATSLGGTIRVQETALNAGGSSAPAVSGATGVVDGAPAVSVPASQTATGSGSASFSGSVDPQGLSTTAHFEYGLDPKYTGGGPVVYGQSTPSVAVGADFNSHPVSAAASGLLPDAIYHVRLVASNGAGTTTGPDQTFTTAATPPPPSPTIAKTANVALVSGAVLIKLPPGESLQPSSRSGRPRAALVGPPGFVPLTEVRQIPLGSQIDARLGTLRLTTASGVRKKLQTATLSGAIFTVAQTRSGRDKGLTSLSLVEGAFPGAPSYASCQARNPRDRSLPFAHAGSSKKALQLLRASDHNGRFRTVGRYSAATVLGTVWDTIDRCDGTVTVVHRGRVLVTNFATRRTVIVHAGQSYLARATLRRVAKSKGATP